MRRGQLFAAALCGLLWCGSAQAQQTVTTSTTTTGGTILGTTPISALAPFDSSLGSLTSITLRIDDGTQTAYHVTAQAPTAADIILSQTFNAVINGIEYSVPVSGELSGTIPVSTFSLVVLSASGSSSFSIDPALFSTFIGTGDQCGPQTGVCAQDETGAGPTLTGLPAGVYFDPQEFETNATYTLTYTYIPASDVPEPRAWALMLLGFACVGLSLRRRSSAGSSSCVEGL